MSTLPGVAHRRARMDWCMPPVEKVIACGKCGNMPSGHGRLLARHVRREPEVTPESHAPVLLEVRRVSHTRQGRRCRR